MATRRPPDPPAPTMGACWSCGRYRWTTAGYCTPCTIGGLDNPWMNCTGCGSVKRRTAPGQTHFTCQRCTEDEEQPR